MTRPAKRNNKHQIFSVIRCQSWILCISLILVLVIDVAFNGSGLVFAKSFACGSVLSFFSQLIIAQMTFRYVGYQARQRIVSQFYMGEISRWLMAIFGFSLIFIFVKPLIPIMVIIGYFYLQLSYIILLWNI